MGGLVLMVAAVALGAAGWRAAGACALDGLARAVAAAVLAVGAATAHALLLGAVGAAHALPLLAAALVTWAAALALLPSRDGTRWETGAAAWIAAGAAVAAAAGWAYWQVRHPNLGFDGLLYHSNLAAIWAREGSTGSVLDIFYGLPVGNYPLANEAGAAWAMALLDGLAIASLWNFVVWGVLACSVPVGLRSLGATTSVAWLAAAAMATLPFALYQLRAPYTDLAAAGWLAACLALCAVAARGAPAALLPALVAGGLAAGAKTTAALIAVAALGWAARSAPRPGNARAWTLAGATALLLAALWPVRNLIEHGAPLWPLATNPGGDPLPSAYALVDDRFAQRPRLLADHFEAYVEVFGGGWVLLLGGLLLPLVAGGRAARIAAAATAAGATLWALAPYTGIEREDLAAGATRYLLPTLLLAVAAIALSRPRAAAITLGAAVAANVVAIAGTYGGFPETPAASSLVAAAAVGAAAGWAWSLRPAWLPLPALAIAAVVAGAVALTAARDGYVARYQVIANLTSNQQVSVSSLLLSDPGFAEGEQPVAMFPYTLAPLTGDGLEHPLARIPTREPCSALEARAAGGWVLIAAAEDPDSRRLLACMPAAEARGQGSGWLIWGP